LAVGPDDNAHLQVAFHTPHGIAHRHHLALAVAGWFEDHQAVDLAPCYFVKVLSGQGQVRPVPVVGRRNLPQPKRKVTLRPLPLYRFQCARRFQPAQ